MENPNDHNNNSLVHSRPSSNLVIIFDNFESGGSSGGSVSKEEFSNKTSRSFSNRGIESSADEAQLANVIFVSILILPYLLAFNLLLGS